MHQRTIDMTARSDANIPYGAAAADPPQAAVDSNYNACALTLDGFRSLDSLSMTQTTAGGGLSRGRLSRELKIIFLKAMEESCLASGGS